MKVLVSGGGTGGHINPALAIADKIKKEIPDAVIEYVGTKRGLAPANKVGVVDSDYRGEVKVILINLGTENFTISHGDRIAQMVVAPVVQAQFQVVESLSATERGQGGFGSTGI